MAYRMKCGPAAFALWLTLPAWLPGTAAAADIADPTRPPSGFAERPREAPPEAPLRVESLFLMGERSYAIIDGRIVRVGERLEAGRITGIDAAGVWLKTASGPRQLKLFPAVEKTPAGKGKERKVEKR